MNINDNPAAPLAFSVLNKINRVDRTALDKIGKALDAAIEEEATRKRTIMDVFRSKAFWGGVRDGLAAPLFLLDSYTSRHPRPVRRVEREPDAALWGAIGRYCADNPEIADAAGLSEAERKKLGAVMAARPAARGKEHALKAG